MYIEQICTQYCSQYIHTVIGDITDHFLHLECKLNYVNKSVKMFGINRKEIVPRNKYMLRFR